MCHVHCKGACGSPLGTGKGTGHSCRPITEGNSVKMAGLVLGILERNCMRCVGIISG